MWSWCRRIDKEEMKHFCSSRFHWWIYAAAAQPLLFCLWSQQQRSRWYVLTTCQRNCLHLMSLFFVVVLFFFSLQSRRNSCQRDCHTFTSAEEMEPLSPLSVHPSIHPGSQPWFFSSPPPNTHTHRPCFFCRSPSLLLFPQEEQMGFNSEGSVGWTWTLSYLTEGEGSHTFFFFFFC